MINMLSLTKKIEPEAAEKTKFDGPVKITQ